MEKEEKSSVGLVIAACILSIIVIVSIIVAVYFAISVSQDNEIVSENENTENKVLENLIPENEFPEEVNKIDDAQGYIYEKEININNSYNMKIPVLNLTTRYATTVNEEVESVYKDTTGKYTVYSYYMYTEMVSLVLDNNYNGGVHTYNIYNISTKTGKKLTNEELISKLNMTKDDVIEKAKAAAKSKFFEVTPGASEEDSLVDECVQKTLKEIENIMEDPMYIDHTGKLCVVAKIYQLAGASSNYYIIESLRVHSPYACIVTCPVVQ